MAAGELVIRVGEVEHRPRPDQPFTFGRAGECTLCLDENDTAISRRAGSFTWGNGIWWLTNDSRSRQFVVVDELGFRTVVPPGRRMAVEGRLRVIVEGTKRGHELVVDAPKPDAGVLSTTGNQVSTSIGADVVLNDADRAALVAMFAGYLQEGSEYDPNPKKYAAAAARLGVPKTTLIKRVEYIKTRLDKAGVPNMTGWNSLSNLAEYVLAAGIITREDLRRINQ